MKHRSSDLQGRQIRPQVTSGDLSSGDSSPEVTTRHPWSPEVTRGHHSPPEVTTRHPRSPLATRGHHSSPEITTRHPRSPLTTRGHHSPPEVTTRHPRSPLGYPRSPQVISRSPSTIFSCSLTRPSVPVSGGASGGVPGSGHGRPVQLLPPSEAVAGVLHLLDGRPRRLVRPADTAGRSQGSVSCFITAQTAILGLVTPITGSCSSVLFW